jgi:hypothetical protein
MPLGVLLLNHFADRIKHLELVCSDCKVQKILETRQIGARHTGFLSVPELRRIGIPECSQGGINCQARFPQLERLFSRSSPRRGKPIANLLSPMTLLRDQAPEDSE